MNKHGTPSLCDDNIISFGCLIDHGDNEFGPSLRAFYTCQYSSSDLRDLMLLHVKIIACTLGNFVANVLLFCSKLVRQSPFGLSYICCLSRALFLVSMQFSFLHRLHLLAATDPTAEMMNFTIIRSFHRKDHSHLLLEVDRVVFISPFA